MKKHLLTAAAALALLLSLSASGAPLVNLGLVGVGRLPADSSDQLGPNVDTLGGIFSGLYLNPADVVKNGNTYSGLALGLPDRGFGDGLTDFHPRVQTISLAVTPYYGPYPASGQNQILFNNTATLLFTQNGQFFTGYNPDDTNQMTYPKSPDTSVGAGKWSLDAEGIARTANGSLYVSDEYGPFVYFFSPAGVLVDVLVPPMAYIPKSGPTYPRPVNFGLAIAQTPTNDSGRYVNRGLEGLSITPDGRKLVTMLQSPTIQDGENRNPSRNGRILIFDIDPASPTFHDPIAEYIYVFTPNANTARNRHTPVSEILALSNTKFLVLERDSMGRGGDPGAIIYKSVVMADVSAASNIIGTGYDLEKGAPGQLSLPRTGLPTNIVAATRTDLVNLADAKQLAKFGLNVKEAWDTNTISEKWEGLAVIPLNDPAAPEDYLLLVGNDNDFKAPLVYHNGVIVGTNEVIIDNMLMVFRIGQDLIPPTIACPAPITFAANSNCMAAIDIRSRATTSDNSAAPITVNQTPAAGTLLGLGSHVITLTAVDAAGNVSAPCTTTITITDQMPPLIASLTPSQRVLSPNGNKLVPITVAVSVADNCDPQPQCEIINVTSNGKIHPGKDDENGSSDWEITGPLSVNLRTKPSEEKGSLNLVYFITVACTDVFGNRSTAVTTVTIAKNKSKKNQPTLGSLTRIKPYTEPTDDQYTIIPLISTGDKVPRTGKPGKEYRMVGIPDGLGAYLNGDDTVTVMMNHEMGNLNLHEPLVGETRDRGAIVSKYILGPDGSVISGDRAYYTIFYENTLLRPALNETNSTNGFARLCSGNLAWKEAGFDRPIYFCGEESSGTATFSGTGGYLLAIFDNEAHILPKAGRIPWENAPVRPDKGNQTVIMCLKDGPNSPDSELFMYVGTKDNRRGATVLGRNGLDNGQLYVFLPKSHTATNEVVMQSGSVEGYWALIPNAQDMTDEQLDAAGHAAGAFGFIRIEDGAFHPSNPNKFFFVTTGGATGNMLGRLYQLDLSKDVLGPARLTVIYNADQIIAAGADIAISPDNIDVSEDYLMICEDGTGPSRIEMANKGRLGNIWRFDLHDRFGAENIAELSPPGRDGVAVGAGIWETSGIIDTTGIFGPDTWLFDVQAHPPTAAPPTNTVEDGQLLLMIRNR